MGKQLTESEQDRGTGSKQVFAFRKLRIYNFDLASESKVISSELSRAGVVYATKKQELARR